ncbi:MAG: CoA transferase [Chloroflexi bacterium]|nr:CoA transferase [Chloroflexota bacterium]
MTQEKTGGMLSPYRVLDLTDEKGLLCGKLLGDLGADVIKVERPGGDPARKIGPFYHDQIDPEKSLFWFAFNTSKRGITLDIESAAGQATFKQLVETADFVVESFPPGYIDRLGLGYSTLEKVNPGIIMVSITPFGQTGPYRDYKAPDIVAWAMGGVMYQWGDADRPPIHMSHHSKAYPNAGVGAAVGAMIALQQRRLTGEGQHVDFSIQEIVAWCTHLLITYWDMMKVVQARRRLTAQRQIWPCQDGYVICFYHGGYQANRHNRPLVQWIDEEGLADDFLKGIDWDTFNFTATTQDVIDRIAEPTGKFFLRHSKAELLEGAVKRRFQLYPVSTTRDIRESVQLTAREYWVEIEHPELGTTITYPGAFAKASETPFRISRRAPFIGEHNQEIYQEESGISKQKPTISGRTEDYPANLKQRSERERLEDKPLAGIRVIDFSWMAAAPLATKILADYGAQVIKIEGRKRHDPQRAMIPFKDGIFGLDRSGGYLYYNTGKLDVTLNLAHPKGVEVAKRLVARSDVVVENFAGGVMKRMGLDYGELRKVKPDIIMLSACMQGQTGPHANHPGLGLHLSALSGFSHITGWPDRQPLNLGVYTDFVVPHFNALAILAALDYRRRSGQGQYIDMSQYEASVHLMAPLILDYVVNQRVASRMGNRSNDAAPHGAYRCRGQDRWCAIAVFSDEEWQNFGKVIGNPAWVKKSKFRTLPSRKENEDELERLVEAWTINHSAEEVMTMLQAAGVAAGVVETGEDLLEHDPQLKHRRFFQELDHPEIGKHYARGPAFMLSKVPCELRRAPLLGEHNEYALKEILGMTDEEIAELVIEGVVE